MRLALFEQLVEKLGDPVIDEVTEAIEVGTKAGARGDGSCGGGCGIGGPGVGARKLGGTRGTGIGGGSTQHAAHARSSREFSASHFCRTSSGCCYAARMVRAPRRVVGDARRWKALSHPVRGEILRHLDEHGPATSTTLAEALGESTGTTSYHLRVLAEAGVIEEVPERAHGRERWWRTFPTDHREPDYETLSPADRAALDEWRAAQIPGEVELFHRFLREFRQHGTWARAVPRRRLLHGRGLDALFEGYLACSTSTGTRRRTRRRGRGRCSCACSTSPMSPPGHQVTGHEATIQGRLSPAAPPQGRASPGATPRARSPGATARARITTGRARCWRPASS